MRRLMRGGLGVVLVIGALLPARSASAQLARQRLWSDRSPIRKVQYEGTPIVYEGHLRLEEMKVELAWLADIAAFPYHLGARASGETLTLRGYVPNELVRQKAVDIAKSNTFLTVRDELRIQRNLSLRPSLRSVELLQTDGAELLRKNLGEAARFISLSAKPNGIVVLTGHIDSVESKVEVSRLMRQLSGCYGVVNQLAVEEVIRDGQRVAQVTRDGSITVPPMALGQQEVVAAPAPIPVAPRVGATTEKKSSDPVLLPPPPINGRHLDAREGELSLPTIAPSSASSPKSSGTSLDALTPPQLPAKWGQPPAPKPVNTPAKPISEKIGSTGVLRTPSSPSNAARSAMSWESQSKKPSTSASSTGMTWHRPSEGEESEPKASVKNKAEKTHPPTKPLSPWPPAYEKGAPKNEGRPGTITFDDDPLPASKPTPLSMGNSHPIAPANLERQVKSICGRQARDVHVETQPDGSIHVHVKVPSVSAGDQLTRKILTIPDMTSPKVRLMMDVGQ
jgi:hypothetical protein